MTDEEMQALADRMSSALTEVGEASIALVLAEREACAQLVEAMSFTTGDTSAALAFEAAADAIRARPK